jgi:ribonuclease HI
VRFTLYSDGSCPLPKGPGGWAAICVEDPAFTVVGNEDKTTNNRMELTAVIMGLNGLPENSVVTVISDSQYVIHGYTRHHKGWVAADWPTRIKNKDLWLEMIDAVNRHKSVAFIFVKGHNNDPDNVQAVHNEMADKLAGAQTLIAKERL